MIALAEIWLPVIGAGIFIAWAIGAWYGGSKVLSIWLIFAGAVCLLLLGTLQWQHALKNESEKPEPTSAGEIALQRAYLFVETVRIINADDDLATADLSKMQTAELVIKNFGKTPAYKVRNLSSLKFTDFPPKADTFEHAKDVMQTSSDTVPQDGRFQIILDPKVALDIPRKQLLKVGVKAIYVFGKIDYEDRFGIKRCTRFRYLVGGNVGFHGKDMQKMSDGNDADVDCDKPN